MNKLRERRLAMKLFQKDVARQVNISRSLYSLIELGICRPSCTNAIAIARVLNSTVEELFDEQPVVDKE